LGFRIKFDHWSRGYATEAAKACVAFGFEKLNLTSIIGRVMHANKASIRVIEKLGMRNPQEFVFDEHPGLKYMLNKEDYESIGR